MGGFEGTADEWHGPKPRKFTDHGGCVWFEVNPDEFAWGPTNTKQAALDAYDRIGALPLIVLKRDYPNGTLEEL